MLVNPKGHIVTRCYCGNPLLAPRPLGASTCTGCPAGYVPPAQCVGDDCYRLDDPDDDKPSAKEEEEPEETPERNSSNLGGGGGSPTRSTQSNPRTQGSDDPQVFTFNGNTSTLEEDDSSNSDDQFQNPGPTPLPTRPPQNYDDGCGDYGDYYGGDCGDKATSQKTPVPPN